MKNEYYHNLKNMKIMNNVNCEIYIYNNNVITLIKMNNMSNVYIYIYMTQQNIIIYK